MTIPHRIGIPAIRVKSSRIIPYGGIIVDVVQGRDDDCVGGEFVPAW
jgi:hypothetical protein